MKNLLDMLTRLFNRQSAPPDFADTAPFPLPVDIQQAETAPTRHGRDALMIAAENKLAAFIAALIACGADIHATDDAGKNAATIALEVGNWSGAIPLLKAGCLVDHNSNAMEWGLRVATHEGDDEFMDAVRLNKTLAPQIAFQRQQAARLAQRREETAETTAIKTGMHQGSGNAPRTKTVRFKNPGAA